MIIRSKSGMFVRPVFVMLLLAAIVRGQRNSSAAPPAWQNPDIGFTLDGIIDAYDVEGPWKSPGVTLRGAELIISANIDPYAFLLGNVLISEHGAELHEAFAVFPYLPLNLKGKVGLMLAGFGRWNRFHTHAMPFTSEPRIFREYAGGMLALKGIEFSWMPPINHYIEITLSAYDRFQGHSHDVDPSISGDTHASGKTADEIAEEIGAEKHGTHWHGPDGEILYEEDLLALAGETTSDDPVSITGNRRPDGFVYGGRITTTFELGPQISIDLGGSALYQHRYKESQRIAGHTYGKLLYGADITLFWHPLTTNKYRNLQLGAEMLGSYEGFERSSGNWILEEYYNRLGVFSWLAWRMSQRWQTGVFGEFFRSNDYLDEQKARYGAFITLDITHYQYLRFEYSRYDYPGVLDGVNRIMLQYDATIGYHTHGRQR